LTVGLHASESVDDNREELTVSGLAIITEACIDVKDRACVDVCPVQCIYEFDPQKNALFSEEEAGSGVTGNTHAPSPAQSRSSAKRCCT